MGALSASCRSENQSDDGPRVLLRSADAGPISRGRVAGSGGLSDIACELAGGECAAAQEVAAVGAPLP